MTEVTVDMDCIFTENTTLDLGVNSCAELVTVVLNVDIRLNTSGMRAQSDPSSNMFV